MEIKMWREILSPYQLAVEELLVKFNHFIKEHRNKGEHSPIESIEGRVKKVSSILDKAQKKEIELDEIDQEIEDLAGIRLICQFVEDIDQVVKMLRLRKDMVIIMEKDYISREKQSGYRSYHIIIGYTVHTAEGSKEIKVEVQIRTLAMNFWGTVEHSLQYKYKGNMPEHIRERLSEAAKAITILDREMSSVRSEIMDAQNSLRMKESVVSDILSNIQSLYRITNQREVMKIQEEFFRIYQLDDLDKLEHFNKELDIISEGYRAQNIQE